MRAAEFISELGISQGRSFMGSPCTRDCSGHRAGHSWADKKNIKHSRECPNNPKHPSFRNGCLINTQQLNKQS
jgi:hypothetical protein